MVENKLDNKILGRTRPLRIEDGRSIDLHSNEKSGILPRHGGLVILTEGLTGKQEGYLKYFLKSTLQLNLNTRYIYSYQKPEPGDYPLLALGKGPLQTILNKKKMDDWHGHIHWYNGQLVGHTYGIKEMFANVDLLPVIVQEIHNLILAAKDPTIIKHPPIIYNFPIIHSRLKSAVVDIEWDIKSQQTHTIGFATDGNKGYSSHDVPGGIALLEQMMKSGIQIIGHNVISADLKHLQLHPTSYAPEHVFDTMVVGHLVHAHFSPAAMLSLGDMMAYYMPLTQWKHDKGDMLEYNGRDCVYNFRLAEFLKKDLDTTQQWHLVQPHQELEALTVEMNQRGVGIDTEGLRKLVEDKQQQKKVIKEILPINPNSPKQILNWAHEIGIPIENSSYDSIIKYSGKNELFDKLIAYREDSKSLSTWFDFSLNKKGEWGGASAHTYPRFKATGTAVDRLSSSSPNYQNIPPHLRHLLIPAEDHIFVSFDGKNAEGRWVAWEANDLNMIADFNSGLDIHQQVANRLSLAAGRDVDRQFAKTVVHASNYGEGPSNLARRLFNNRKKSSLDAANALQYAYFKAYPATKQWHSDVERQLSGGNILLKNAYGRVRYIFGLDDRERVKRGCHFLGCSAAAETVNRYAVGVWKEFGYVPVLIVHDEILLQIPVDELSILPRIIEYLFTPLKEMTKLAFPFGMKMGYNYGELKEVKEPLKWRNL